MSSTIHGSSENTAIQSHGGVSPRRGRSVGGYYSQSKECQLGESHDHRMLVTDNQGEVGVNKFSIADCDAFKVARQRADGAVAMSMAYDFRRG